MRENNPEYYPNLNFKRSASLCSICKPSSSDSQWGCTYLTEFLRSTAGVSRARFVAVHYSWVEYCYEQRRADDRLEQLEQTPKRPSPAALSDRPSVATERLPSITSESFPVTLAYALSVLGRRVLASASHNAYYTWYTYSFSLLFPSNWTWSDNWVHFALLIREVQLWTVIFEFNSVELFLLGLNEVFKGNLRVTSSRDEWCLADMRFLDSVLQPAIRLALKLHQVPFWNCAYYSGFDIDS